MVAKYIPALAGPDDVLPAGSLFLLWPGSGGFDIGDVFEGAVSIVTGVIDAGGLLVNEISKAYDSIKKAVGDVIVSAISATGLVDCESSPLCQQLVATAISTGLMAAGLPPSLPNWNAVVDQGYEYLAAEIVTQAGAGSVPSAQELTKAAVQALVEKTIQEMSEKRGGGGGLPDWLSIDVGHHAGYGRDGPLGLDGIPLDQVAEDPDRAQAKSHRVHAARGTLRNARAGIPDGAGRKDLVGRQAAVHTVRGGETLRC